MEQRCVLCCSREDDELIFGKVHKKGELLVHCNCLYLSSNLIQNGTERNGILNFLKKDIILEQKRCESIKCCYCQREGANIGCCRRKCHHNFHTKCGYDNLAVSQFTGSYNSYCHKHHPKYHFRPEPKERCMICFEHLVPKRKRFTLATGIHSPCCKNGWYHRKCLQKYANSAGYFFKCPLCNDEEKFAEVSLFGISIPNCDASWELEPNAYADQMQRAQRCTARRCRLRASGNRANDGTELLYCIMCGSNPVHSQCTTEKAGTYQCADCIVVKPDVVPVSTDSEMDADVFESFFDRNLHLFPAIITRRRLHDTTDLRHSKLLASVCVSSDSDDDDDEDDFDKVFKKLNDSRQRDQSPPGPSRQSRALPSPGSSSQARASSPPGPSRPRQSRALPSSSSSQAASSNRPVARFSRPIQPGPSSQSRAKSPPGPSRQSLASPSPVPSSQARAKPSPGPSSSSSQAASANRPVARALRPSQPGPSSQSRAKSPPGPSVQSRAKPSPGPSGSSSQAASSNRRVGRPPRQTLPATIPEQNENNKLEKAKKRRGSSISPVAESGSRRLLQPISPMATSSRSNVFGSEPRRRRTMPPSRFDNAQRFNMDESCVANRTRTRLPTYMANRKDTHKPPTHK